ncbi:predicted protein [Naegleria gruberi]|uniref:Predicted protein n=1 Tax=Naegleria gruberi TaxID=5762 RepID=D2VC05_NAEGR|nr:uncharacterized protein NAEGRDRAFT_66401 [Naegleria gruberi]EFC45570.1 predicted protein [Naegleria gruberi]|eukprot:XP_002678314.1 predicted protein [Naegleria gruberi strain NEG-M]
MSLHDDFTKELLITVGTFLPLSDLNNFARCDTKLLDLFFNLTTEKVNAIAKRKKELSKKNIESRIVALKGEYSKSEDSNIQKLIWKPLVLFYFPNYSTSVNVKNWMHVMRRRIIHLDNKFPNELPLLKERTTIAGFNLFRVDKDRQFIENCEWEYECPLKSNAFKVVSPNVKYCKVCKENVYEVFTMEEFKSHVEQDHCVSFSEFSRKQQAELGKRKRGKIRVVETNDDNSTPSKKLK